MSSHVSQPAAAGELLARRKARESLLDFTLYTKPDYQVSWHHRALCEALDRFVAGETTRLMVSMPPRHGKALTLDTPIPTPTGWATIRSLQPGDLVFAGDGRPCKVVAKSPIWKDRPVYKVITDDGDEIIADAAHEWLVRLCGKREVYHIHTTERLAAPRQKRAMIRRQGQLALPTADLLIDPYVLGAWLGDGCSQHATMTAGDEDRPFMRAEFERAGYHTSDRITHSTFGVLGLQKQLRELGLLNNKHIPATYLRANADQRLALLQGLIDTDGYVAPDGQVEFCSTNLDLAIGCREIVHSLGRKASLIGGRATINGRDCGAKYRVMFYLADAARLPRKAALCRDVTKTPHRYVRAEPAGRADTVCIEVDSPSHLFLCGRSMLPTHNSELVSRRLPAYLLGKDPNLSIIACSYSADLASMMNRDVQRIIDGPEYTRIFPETSLFGSNVRTVAQGSYLRNSDIFEIVGNRGIYRSAGVGGGITGMGADVGILDDVCKNQEEANSPTYREKVWEWYTTTFYTRLEKNARVLVTMTRWHEDDLVGRLIEAAKDDNSDQWEIIKFPAIAEPGNPIDPRPEGAPLWPEKYSIERLNQMKATLGAYPWAALYQQAPAPAGGGLFKRDWFQYFDVDGADYILHSSRGDLRVPSHNCTVFQTCDPAGSTKTSADYFALGTWAVTPTQDTLLLDVVHRRLEGPDQPALFHESFQQWQPSVQGVEARNTGLTLFQQLKRDGLPVVELKPDSDKFTRALPMAARYESGCVYHLANAPWLVDYELELVGFPGAAHDDQVDMAAYACVLQQQFCFAGVAIESPIVDDRSSVPSFGSDWSDGIPGF